MATKRIGSTNADKARIRLTALQNNTAPMSAQLIRAARNEIEDLVGGSHAAIDYYGLKSSFSIREEIDAAASSAHYGSARAKLDILSGTNAPHDPAGVSLLRSEVDEHINAGGGDPVCVFHLRQDGSMNGVDPWEAERHARRLIEGVTERAHMRGAAVLLRTLETTTDELSTKVVDRMVGDIYRHCEAVGKTSAALHRECKDGVGTPEQVEDMDIRIIKAAVRANKYADQSRALVKMWRRAVRQGDVPEIERIAAVDPDILETPVDEQGLKALDKTIDLKYRAEYGKDMNASLAGKFSASLIAIRKIAAAAKDTQPRVRHHSV